MQPQRSYIIWFTPRCGSTLLCKLLEQTGLAGNPGEFFTIADSETLREKYQVRNYERLQSKLWRLGTSSNGIMGMKYSMYTGKFKKLLREIRNLRAQKESSLDANEILHDIFPNCKHIYLARRNKVRQAVSWWKAIQDQVWHLQTSETHIESVQFYEEKYDFAALRHLLIELTLRECATQEYFQKFEITPLTLVYENFIKDFPGTIQCVFDYLGIDQPVPDIPNLFYQKTATENSEIWVQRFRQELQADVEDKFW